MRKSIIIGMVFWTAATFACQVRGIPNLPANQWIMLWKDTVGARRGSAVRYVPETGSFFLWGFMDHDPELLQEQPLMEVPEYDMVSFDPIDGHWRNQLPKEWEAQWSKKLPLAYVPRTYSAITTGSERTVLRGPTEEKEGASRPDLNIVFDQVTYCPDRKSLIYFTGGLTAAYQVAERRWSDLAPAHSPPPVLGGSLAHDPLHNEVVLFGGGHVAERELEGKAVGYTGTWVYRVQQNDWQRLPLAIQPPPRMNTRMVCDTKNQVLVLFGGDSQSHYLADTWLYDLKDRTWRSSKASSGPSPRAGHFSVFDPETGWVIIGGGYNRKDATDMWAYDAAQDRWQKLVGEVPTGFYISGDIAPDKRLILLVTNTRRPNDTMTCNILYPVRTTYGYRIEKGGLLEAAPSMQSQVPMRKQEFEGDDRAAETHDGRHQVQSQQLSALSVNQWLLLTDSGRAAPTRTWGSATFDTDREQILYWGGGHCGYEGNDVDAYDVQADTWRSLDSNPEYPERLWNHGVRLAGVTFQGKSWTEHGRRIYAYDPVSHKMIMVRTIRLTTGYDPEPLKQFPSALTSDYQAVRDALVNPPSSYVKYVTWSFDPANSRWELLGSAPTGLDTLVTTRQGVMGINVNWPSRLNDAGYLLPWDPSLPPEDKAIFLLNAGRKEWKRLSLGQPSPQNLYEMTSLAYDSKRDQVILHGAGQKRDELWIFDVAKHSWKNMQPAVLAPVGAAPPACAREAVYLPVEDAFLIYGSKGTSGTSPAIWSYKVSENAWYQVDIPGLDSHAEQLSGSQNRAMVYDPKRDLVLLVLGTSGDEGRASVYAMKYRHDQARLIKANR